MKKSAGSFVAICRRSILLFGVVLSICVCGVGAWRGNSNEIPQITAANKSVQSQPLNGVPFYSSTQTPAPVDPGFGNTGYIAHKSHLGFSTGDLSLINDFISPDDGRSSGGCGGNSQPESSALRREITEKLKSQDKVKITLFVMSQCPFGTMAETAIGKLLPSFGDRLDLKVNYIASEDPSGNHFSSMHGAAEVSEDIRQLVIARYFPDKFLAYLTARAKDYSSGDWKQFAVANEIDATMVEKISNSAEGKELLRQNIREANIREIAASPTVLIDDEKFQGEVFALKAPLSFMAIPSPCQTGTDPETNSPWVVCLATASRAWIAANTGGTYHATQICNNLGYASVNRFGGTCGTVCGYCGSGSCSANGNEIYDGGGNQGSDAFGLKLANTVHWECTGTVVTPIDVGITKTDSVTTAVPGNQVTYTITASNLGGAVNPVSVVDSFPPSITSDNWTCIGAGGGVCGAASGSGNINDTTVNLPVGASVTYTATANISPSATGSMSNTATVTAAGDIDPANNTATDTDTLTPQAESGSARRPYPIRRLLPATTLRTP